MNPKLHREYILCAIRQAVANNPGATVEGVRNMHTGRRNVDARYEAWERIIEETRCGYGELASVWGCSAQTIYDAVGAPLNVSISPGEMLRARLNWQYDADRVSLILNGQDPATEVDRRAWKALGTPRHER